MSEHYESNAITEAIATVENIFAKYGCKVITPGDAEFEKVASECTPLAKIRAPFPKCIPTPHSREEIGICGRRNESNNKLR